MRWRSRFRLPRRMRAAEQLVSVQDSEPAWLSARLWRRRSKTRQLRLRRPRRLGPAAVGILRLLPRVRLPARLQNSVPNAESRFRGPASSAPNAVNLKPDLRRLMSGVEWVIEAFGCSPE